MTIPQTNEFGQPIGAPLPNWQPAERPTRRTLSGVYCDLVGFDPEKHAHSLYEAYATAEDGRHWTYLPAEPFESFEAYDAWAREMAGMEDPLHYAVIDKRTGRAVGTLALLRHDPTNGVIEVGWVVFSSLMQRTPISTEAQFLLMRYVFDELGYRRYEWKCDSLNEPSRRAAKRLGFTYEGTFRQLVVTKGRNRDTAWYSITDAEWPGIRAAFESWLAPSNFGEDGTQLTALRTPGN